jgi:hypothetical protein
MASGSGHPQRTCWSDQPGYDHYSMVINSRRQWEFPAISSQSSEKLSTFMIHDVIRDMLDILSFSSIYELAMVICTAIRTIDWHLIRSLGLIMNHFHSFLQNWRETRRVQYVTLSNESWHKFRSLNYQHSHFAVTLDEFWFYFTRKYEQILFRLEQELLERSRYRIQGKKMLMMIAWSTLGFCLIESLPKGRTLNLEG